MELLRLRREEDGGVMKALVHDDASLKGHTAFSVLFYNRANFLLEISGIQGASRCLPK